MDPEALRPLASSARRREEGRHRGEEEAGGPAPEPGRAGRASGVSRPAAARTAPPAGHGVSASASGTARTKLTSSGSSTGKPPSSTFTETRTAGRPSSSVHS